MAEDEFDPILLDRIEREIEPLVETLAKQTLENAKRAPGKLQTAPVPFIFDDDVVFNDGRFEFHDFDRQMTQSDDEEVILDLLVTAWVTHIMAELDEGDQYDFDEIVQLLSSQISGSP